MKESCSQLSRFAFIVVILLLPTIDILAQARLILNNGGIINLTGGAVLVIDNAAANAITRNTSGHIISEGENNIIKWNIGTTAASYTIPWGYGSSNYIPVSFTTSGASGSGYFNFSTYHTNWNNSAQLPTGITTFTNGSGADNSAYVLDRFWQVNATGYTTKPTLSSLVFTYLDIEHSVASNTIAEANLKAQRYNDNTNNWGDYLPTGTVSTVANTVTIATLSATNLYKWWTLVDMSTPLPIELISFNATPDGSTVKLDWRTGTEINNDFFTVQRSKDGMEFADLAKITAGKSGGKIQQYSYIDVNPLAGRSYYRLKQTDLDGAFKYSDIRTVNADDDRATVVTAFPNPVVNNEVSLDFHTALEKPVAVVVYNLIGNTIFSGIADSGVRIFTVDLNHLPKGIYIVKTYSATLNFQQTIVLQ